MKKVFILLLLFLSCEQKYEYINVVRTSSLLTGNTEIKEKRETIKSKNDSTAYFDAYTTFNISKKMYEKNNKEYGDKKDFKFYFDEPIRFELLNKEGDNLAILPEYKDREQSEQRIRKVVYGMSHLQ